MTHTIQTLSVSFDLKLQKYEIPLFRKRVWRFVGWGADVFHNHHIEEGIFLGNLNRYPLVQYRTHEGYANLWGVNKGAEAIAQLAANDAFLTPLSQSLIQSFALKMLPDNAPRLYKVFGYVPFNKQSYTLYQQCDAFYDRITLLEKSLLNHIVSFGYGVGWEMNKDTPLELSLYDISYIGRAVYQPSNKQSHNTYTAFDLSFFLNADLPDQAGIGMLTGLGYGLLKRIATPNPLRTEGNAGGEGIYE